MLLESLRHFFDIIINATSASLRVLLISIFKKIEIDCKTASELFTKSSYLILIIFSNSFDLHYKIYVHVIQ